MKAQPERYIRLTHDLMRTAAWQTLSAGAVRVLLYLWSLHNGRNNGEIACTLSDLQRQFHCGRSAAFGWLRELEDRRFIVATRRGSFQTKSGSYVSRTTTWRLTMEKFERRVPTREYLSWTPPVQQEQNP